MYHVRACCRAPSVLPCRNHSTAQRNHPARKTSTCRSECNNASKQSWGEPARRRELIQHAEFSERTKKLKEFCPAYKIIQLLTEYWCDARKICLSFDLNRIRSTTSLSLRPFYSPCNRKRPICPAPRHTFSRGDELTSPNAPRKRALLAEGDGGFFFSY